MTENEKKADEIGGEDLIIFFNLVQVEQLKRWNVPDWRTAPITEADLTNWRDVAAALRAWGRRYDD